ncbi:MAG: sulfatase-like hydrolase/transferase [Bacteroidetes bacterium]|nr:sulfatase-like hydrolase/transferase [Bacteroidota bacterium]
MRRILINFILQFLFWILFFAFARVIFLVYHARLLAEEHTGFLHTLASFWYALKLDAATTCYILVFPFLLLVVQSLYSPPWLNVINKIYTAVVLFVYSLITTAELGIYFEWKTKLHYKALMYLMHPKEIYDSAETSTFIILLAILIIQFLGGLLFYLNFFYKPVIHFKRKIGFSVLFFIVTSAVLFVGGRGGLQPIPINQSESYYSRFNILNLASTNSAFNLYISFYENHKYLGKNPFNFYDLNDAKKEVSAIYSVPTDTTIQILKTNRPNIVILILESWAGDLIGTLGGEPGIAPEFHELEKSGLLFTNIYVSGTRSEQGMGCIFSGFPSHPISSIAVQPDKYTKLPSIIPILKNQGYATSFYFGGQLIYGNIKSYIIWNDFDRIKEVYDFDDSLPRGKLGIHDQYTLNEQLNDLMAEKQPFFSALFTVSTHSPFDMPIAEKIDWGYNANINDYLNSAHYTDHCLGDYFRKAAKETWFDNTLFILVADHSHYSQKNWNYYSPQYHKIPLLFYGNVIKDEFKGKTCARIGSQTDIAATLFGQMGLSAAAFHWSKNLLNPYCPQFAYVAFEEGIGWIRPEGSFFFDNRINHYYYDDLPSASKDQIIREGKSFLEVLFQEYLDY